MPSIRPKLTEDNSSKFKHEDFPDELFEMMHPLINTKNCDVIILPFNQDPGHMKQVAIPMHRSLLQKIPYFEGQFKNNVDWRETRKTQSLTESVECQGGIINGRRHSSPDNNLL